MRSAGCQQVEDVTLTSHDCASSEKCTSICGNAEQLLELPPDASVRKHTSRDFKGKLNELDLAFDHLGCGLRKYLMQDFLRFVDFLVRYQMSWRLGTKWQNSSENNCRQGTKSNHISPSLRDFRESSSKCVRNELSSSHEQVVEDNQPSSISRGCKFSYVQGDDHGSTTYAESNDESSNRHLNKTVCSCLDDGSVNEYDTAKVDCKLSSHLVSRQTSDKSSDKCTSRSDGCNQFLFARGQRLATKGSTEGDKDGGDDTSIITLLKSERKC